MVVIADRSQYGFASPREASEPLQAEHRRVGGEEDELAPVRRQLEPAVERAAEVGLDLDRVLVEPAVAEAERELGSAAAAGYQLQRFS